MPAFLTSLWRCIGILHLRTQSLAGGGVESFLVSSHSVRSTTPTSGPHLVKYTRPTGRYPKFPHVNKVERRIKAMSSLSYLLELICRKCHTHQGDSCLPNRAFTTP